MNDLFKITYIFKFHNKPPKTFELSLDNKTLHIVRRTKRHPLAWTRLDYKRCSVCTLSEDQDYCPTAVNMADIAMEFRNIFSHEEVDVMVKVQERSYLASTTIQQALSSHVGIIMASSGCPVLEYLKPMVRFHLPFASVTETAFRMMSMYLMARYIVWKSGGKADFELDGLKRIYKDVSAVNRDFCERLRAASEKDANLNAIVNLDCFANLIPLMIKETIEEMKPHFSAYLKK